MRPLPQRIRAASAVARLLHTQRSRRAFHLTNPCLPRKRHFFTSNVYLFPEPTQDESSPKRKAARPAKDSLRRVAIIAQQPAHRAAGVQRRRPGGGQQGEARVISAMCVAEAFNMTSVLDILKTHGFAIDPDGTGFEPSEVVHARGDTPGDVFVFPSGTIVTWSAPADVLAQPLLRAAEQPHVVEQREVENLEYVPDPSRETSIMRGDVVLLGTKREEKDGDRLDTTLAKVAFSSGLARSTKLAALESALTAYFETTRNIPSILSQGSRLPIGRRFILQKTGELLSLRARLNHYSELTDSLPDIFWDSRSELGLEGYYDQVGRALDVNVRIRTLNQKMDYAQEIASVLREMSSEQHSTRLEWIIILLIAVEVIFELRRIVLESWQEKDAASSEAA